jgi:hypothetical protein
VAPEGLDLASALNHAGWDFQPMSGAAALRMDVEGESGRWACYAIEQSESAQYVIYSAVPMPCPANRRAATMELLTRANFGLIVGNFELDLDDGEVRFKTSLDVDGDRLSVPLARRLVAMNLHTMDQYLPAILAAMSGALGPLEALALAEGTVHNTPSPSAGH